MSTTTRPPVHTDPATVVAMSTPRLVRLESEARMLSGVDAEVFCPFAVERGRDQLLDARGQSRQAADEAEKLVHQQRQQQHHDEREDEEDDGHDRRGRPQPAPAPLLQPVRQRIERVGEDGAGGEGQQNLPEQNQRDHEAGQHAEPDEGQLAAAGHHGAGSLPAAVAASPVAMWRTQSTR